MQKNIEIQTEILIIGGGIAGCIAALSLANNFQVTIIDKLTTPIDRVGESLAPTAQRILHQLNIFENDTDAIQKGIFLNSIGMQSYWGSNTVQFVDHLRNPDGGSKSLDRAKFENHLRQKAIHKGVNCLWGYRLFTSKYIESLWEITAKSTYKETNKIATIKAQFVIDATGRNSFFTRSLGIQRTHIDKLISCWMSFPNTKPNTMSTIVSEQNGWWYSAVIPGNKRVLSFQTDPDIVPKHVFKNKDEFIAFTTSNPIMKELLDNCSSNKINFHGTVSANSTRLQQVAGKQWIALGDAAISFDPLSSQGMFNAMATAMQMSTLLLEHNFIQTKSIKDLEIFTHTYVHQIESIWKHYVHHKNLYYSSEKRWKTSTFWQRRHQNVTELV